MGRETGSRGDVYFIGVRCRQEFWRLVYLGSRFLYWACALSLALVCSSCVEAFVSLSSFLAFMSAVIRLILARISFILTAISCVLGLRSRP